MPTLEEILNIPPASKLDFPSHRQGRPCQFTPESRGIILAETLRGNFESDAAATAGILVCTLAKWLEKGRQSVEFCTKYPDEGPPDVWGYFYLDFHYARALYAASVRESIDKAFLGYTDRSGRKVPGNPLLWVAWMTLRERRDPLAYGKTQTLALQQNVTHKIVFDVVDGEAWTNRQPALEANTVGSDFIPEREAA